MSFNITAADAIAWFCGNSNATATIDTILVDDAKWLLTDGGAPASLPCLSLAVPSLIGSLFVVSALASAADFLLFLRPRTSTPEFPTYLNIIVIFLHICQVCICVFLGTTGFLQNDDDFFFSSQAIKHWLAVCSAAWIGSLLLFSIVTYGGGRKCEVYLLHGWWLLNSFCLLPTILAYSLHITSRETPKTTASILFGAMVVLQLPTSIASIVSSMCGACRTKDDLLDAAAYQQLSQDSSRGSSLLPNPLVHASWLSIVSFSWCKSLLKRGAREAIQASHLWSLAHEDTAAKNAEIFIRCWKRRKPWISLAMLTAYWRPFIWCGVMTVSCALLDFIGPWSVGRLIFFAQNPTVPWYVCIAYVSALAVGKSVQGTIIQHYTFLCARVSIRLSSALKHAIYSKMLVLSPGERQNRSAGDMVNNISTDVQKIVSSFLGFWNILTLPMQIGLSMYLLWRQVSAQLNPGACVMCMYMAA
jgi:hypothetical protein